jgi:adenosine deaminase
MPMALFSSEMAMINTLRPLYKAAHISLHAGELAYGMVPPDSLCCHIRQSIELGHAERIGHGVDVLYENAPLDLIAMMKQRNVLVEICLTSNDGILGVRGSDHPFRTYAAGGVPLALCTDDEGVSRGDITNEYVRAVREQGATYQDLKRMARNSIEHAFIGGKSLWSDPVAFTMTSECAGARAGATLPPKCRDFLERNEKARLQWRLEEELARFEAEAR